MIFTVPNTRVWSRLLGSCLGAVRLGVFSMRIIKSASPWEKNLLRFLLTVEDLDFLGELGKGLETQWRVSLCLGCWQVWNTVPVLEWEQQNSPRRSAGMLLQFPLAGAAPPLGQGQSLLSLQSVERTSWLPAPNPVLSATEQSKRMSRC